MVIRATKPEEISILMEIFASAKVFMRQSGNANQWAEGYPSVELIAHNIESGHSYVCLDDTGEIVATFFFRIGTDETYFRIDDGQWLNDQPYGVVHRLASTGKIKNISTYCLEWCLEQCENIRIDTHADNIVMQNALIRNGYEYCGIIYLKSGARRLAFQKVKTKK